MPGQRQSPAQDTNRCWSTNPFAWKGGERLTSACTERTATHSGTPWTTPGHLRSRGEDIPTGYPRRPPPPGGAGAVRPVLERRRTGTGRTRGTRGRRAGERQQPSASRRRTSARPPSLTAHRAAARTACAPGAAAGRPRGSARRRAPRPPLPVEGGSSPPGGPQRVRGLRVGPFRGHAPQLSQRVLPAARQQGVAQRRVAVPPGPRRRRPRLTAWESGEDGDADTGRPQGS
jgi:hypothetical protein